MMKKEKQEKIIEILRQHGVISIKELAQLLECTEMTARRNLDELEKLNLVRRERGFATLSNAARTTDYYEQSEENPREKAAIARAALAYVRPGSSICIDSGTTTQQLAAILPKDIPLSIITPSLTISMALAEHPAVQILMPGGIFHHSNRSLLIEDVEMMRHYHASVAFMSCLAFRIPGGAFEDSQAMTATKKSLAAIADRRILLMDYSKWNVPSLCNSLPLSDIDIIITDDKAPEETVREAAALGKEILVVSPENGSAAEHYNAPA